MLEDFQNSIRRGAFGWYSTDSPDHSAQFARGDALPKRCSRRFRDAFLHQRTTEIIGSRLEALQRLLESHFHPRNLDIGDIAAQQDSRQGMDNQILADRVSCARMSALK